MSVSLEGVHPLLISAATRTLELMSSLGHPMMVTDAVRSLAKQQTLYAQGRTTAGQIVTQADGIIKRSNHQVKDDGFGHALDACFVVNGQPTWDEHLPWRLYGEIAKALGCKWGGDFVNFPDKPHIEWP